MMAENQPAPLTPAPPGMVSLGVNADGEEVMTVIGGGGGAGFFGGGAGWGPGGGPPGPRRSRPPGSVAPADRLFLPDGSPS